MSWTLWGDDLSATPPTRQRQHRKDGSTMTGTSLLYGWDPCPTKPSLPTFLDRLRAEHPALARTCTLSDARRAWNDVPTRHFRPEHVEDAFRSLRILTAAPPPPLLLVDGGRAAVVDHQKDYLPQEETTDDDDVQRGRLE